ncbi:FKBP-type peptidyl-prolyl cis-trans isomerase [Reinekea marinisedimentorum]|uniref:Peptidyl-prolyl cis-trans isomerase n=1 Tax=Reinekea marinisedimentorum TaxID=230495 RepID=A0A4R3I4Y9_9GAMM|nr:FKBP-type peptidyl-prolyl cis-trans isomerase [Reinekea marinisedimentorum]TCS41013.1 peptidylprolyl isomerase [Reinekea marinisedimentorum]
MSKLILVAIVVVVALFLVKRGGGSGKAMQVNLEEGAKYLEQNKQVVGVTTTASGLQYEVLKQGNSEVHPSADDTVTVHYEGQLIDGTVFDSSVARGEPISFSLKQVIPGWTEGLQLMVVGEKARFVIPNELAYGRRSAGKIPPGAVLVFEVELLGIDSQ